MAAIGKNHPLVLLIHKKTKVKIVDIVDVLGSMAECVPEAFLSTDLEAKKPFDIGGIYLFWKVDKAFGSALVIKPSMTFRSYFTKLKLEKKTPLAALLFEMMAPVNKNRALKKAKTSNFQQVIG